MLLAISNSLTKLKAIGNSQKLHANKNTQRAESLIKINNKSLKLKTTTNITFVRALLYQIRVE